MNATDVKLLNGWAVDDTEQDEMIEDLIPYYVEIAEDYCKNEFKDTVPHGVKKFVATCIKMNDLSLLRSRSMGTVSYNFVTEVPDSTYRLLAPYRKLSW